tara:strand:+ start:102 stop:398 length:297 start_codon:yes stop_codon:yes gene_type:complete
MTYIQIGFVVGAITYIALVAPYTIHLFKNIRLWLRDEPVRDWLDAGYELDFLFGTPLAFLSAPLLSPLTALLWPLFVCLAVIVGAMYILRAYIRSKND